MSENIDVEELLRSTFKREIEESDLYPLDFDFYEKVRSYISKVIRSMGKDPYVTDKVSMIAKTASNIFLIRLIKEITHLLFYGKIPDIIIPKEEKEIIENIRKIISNLSSFETPTPTTLPREKPSTELMLVAFVKPYTKIVLSDGRRMGPFAVGDLAIIPKVDALELQKKGVARILLTIGS